MKPAEINQQRRQLMLKLLGIGGAASLGLISPRLMAAGVNSKVLGVSLSSSKKGSRIVFKLDKSTNYNIFSLPSPERIVIDLLNTATTTDLTGSSSLIKNIRFAPRNDNDLRVVLDLTTAAKPNSFELSPDADHNYHRLVVDLSHLPVFPLEDKTTKKVSHSKLRDLVVMIDPGHGGKDPGAVGKHGTYEKDVVLSIAKKLHAQLNAQRGIKAYLTRDKDVYLHLRERTRIAHQHNADLFVSIHADASVNSKVTGSSVYILSENGASSEMARQLARSQNGVDPEVGNIDLSGKSKMLASVLVDLSQTASISSSTLLAQQLLGQFERKLNNRVERAGFAVLKSPDIPSVLVETAFISNPAQERLLKTSAFQHKMAGSIHEGILSYFQQYAPSDTLLASLSAGQATS